MCADRTFFKVVVPKTGFIWSHEFKKSSNFNFEYIQTKTTVPIEESSNSKKKNKMIQEQFSLNVMMDYQIMK